MGINFQNVNFKYSSKQKDNTLKDISLNINECGEFITIVGHTGSGKSTLSQLMNSLLLPNSGNLTIFDKEIKPENNKDLKYIRSRVGLVFQFPEYQLFEETILKDVMFGPINFGKTKEEGKQIAIESLTSVGLDESYYDSSPFNLSGGQMRRVAIAGILASQPKILILDEPTVGLDPKGKREITDLLLDIHHKTNKTIIVITHNMDVVAKCSSRVIILDEGQIVGDMTPRELFNNFSFLEEYHLDYPEATRLALGLKEKGLINFNTAPITKEELKNVIISQKSTNNGDNNE